MKRDVYSASLKLLGEECEGTLIAANNYADSLSNMQRFEEAKSLLRKVMPVARRVLGEGNETSIRMRLCYAKALVLDDSTTVDDLCEAVTMLEDAERIARRVLGGAHPLVEHIEYALGRLGEALRARETRCETPS